MNRHLRYLSYLARHKWFVAYAAIKMRLTPWDFPRLWLRLLVHDASKLLPSEWLPYVESFYDGYKWDERPQAMTDRFDRAWLLHQHRNDHHWQHWILREDDGEEKLLEISDDAALEMVCDWAGAGRAMWGKWDLGTWYAENRDTIKLHANTRRVVDATIRRFWR